MLWRKEIVREIGDHLVRLGLSKCPVCDSDSALTIHPRPAILPIGGSPWPNPPRHPGPEPGANILFMVLIRCDLCGHSLLFDSERFHDGDTPVFDPEP